MSPRRALLQPRWIVAHLMILTVVVTFPLLGLWQVDRWQEQQAIQADIEQRRDAAPVALTSVLEDTTSPEEAASLAFTPVRATGRYVAGEQVAHRNRAFGGQGGFDWLTPLVLEDGQAVLVRRGWVPPAQAAGTEPTSSPPPDGEVTVTGWLEQSGSQPDGIGARDPASGTLDTVFHADVDRIDEQTSADLLPMILRLESQHPAPAGELPVPQPLPDGEDGSQNISYAVQWFTFTAIAIVGYAIVLRRRVREARTSPGDPVAEAPTTGRR